MALYRQAFQAVLRDREFLAESAKQRFGVDPLDDRQIQALLVLAYGAPKQVRDRAVPIRRGDELSGRGLTSASY